LKAENAHNVKSHLNTAGKHLNVFSQLGGKLLL
jgi:hypothetical protein